jgi:hypothetical protein
LYVLLNYCTLGLGYLALRGFGRERVLLGLLSAGSLCIGKGVYIPSYNQVTALIFAGSAVALYYGLVRRSSVLVVLGGFIAGVSVFARIVNLPIVLLAAGVWYYQYISTPHSQRRCSSSLKRSAPDVLRFVLGFACGLLVILLLIAALGHFGAFRQMLVGLFGIASDAKTGYSPVHLLKAFLWDYFYTGACAVCFVVIVLLVGSAAAKMTRSAQRGIWATVCAGGVMFLLLKWPDLNVWAIPAMLYVVLLAAACGVLGSKAELRLLCVLAGIVLFVIPLGSADGMNNSVYGMYLALPTALIALMTAGGDPRARESSGLSPAVRSEGTSLLDWAKGGLTTKLDMGAVVWLCAFSIISFSLVYRLGFTYRDSPDRSAMNATVNHPKLRAVFTTRSRARALEELLTQLQPLVRKDDYLLEHMQSPLVYFLTESRPYLYTSWANLYQPSEFERAMKRALATRASLPVCVKTKVDTCHPKWPDETYPLLQSYRFASNRRTVESFLQTRHYQKRWENNAFEIWTPAASK